MKRLFYILIPLFFVLKAEVYLELDNLDLMAGTVDVFYTSNEDLGGFQFGFDGAYITGALGGIAEENNFELQSSESTLIGFSFSGEVIPAGNGLLTIVNLNFTGNELCLSNPIISGPMGGLLDVTTGGCLNLPQIQLNLSIFDQENQSFYVELENYAEIVSFQLVFSGIEIVGFSGGIAQEYQFDIILDEESGIINGTMTSEPLPAGNHILSSFNYSHLTGPEVCIHTVEFYGENNFAYNVDTGVCAEVPCGCMDELALNYDENALCPAECDYTAFEFVGTTQQAFYIIENLTIDGEPITNTDFEIGAFNHDTVCVGAVQWPGHDTTLAVFGNDFITPGSDLNMEPGQIPTFIAFNSVTQQFYDVEIEACSNLLGQFSECRWYNAGFNSISNLVNTAYSIEYDFLFGNNLFSLPGINPALEGLEGTSDAVTLMNYLDDMVGVQFLIGQGIGLFHTSDGPNGWSGNLNDLTPYSGYWINIGNSLQSEFQFDSGIQNCESYSIAVGNNLLSFRWGDNDIPTLDALGGESFASDHFNFIIGQGVGLFKTGESWSGNLNNLKSGKGYWINIGDADFGNTTCEGDDGNEFCWGFDQCLSPLEIDNNMENTNLDKSSMPHEFQFTQSTEQAFYLFEHISGAETGDILLAYCNGTHVGTSVWGGKFTHVPVMGRDISPQTEGFCEAGDIPDLKLLKMTNQEMKVIDADIPQWSSLAVYMVDHLTMESSIIPSEIILHPAYPNPFNPFTTITFEVPKTIAENRLKIEVFDINGEKVVMLLDGKFSAGKNSIEWNAVHYPSGVYFVKLSVGGFNHIQKVMLMK